MSSGNQHDRAAIALGCTFIGTAIALPSPFLLMGLGSFLHLILSPDLDAYRSNAKRRWGALGFIWIPYSKTFKHRSPWTHVPIVGTTGRFIYLNIIALFAIALAVVVNHVNGDRISDIVPTLISILESIRSFWLPLLPHVFEVWAGLAIADITHWVMDGCPLVKR